MNKNNKLQIILDSIQDLKNYLELEVLEGNKKFLNEGLISYKLCEQLIKNWIDRKKLRYMLKVGSL